MSDNKKFLDDSNLSKLNLSPQARSTAIQPQPRQRPCPQSLGAVSRNLFEGCDSSLGLLPDDFLGIDDSRVGTFGSADNNPGRTATLRKLDHELSTMIKESKNQMTSVVSSALKGRSKKSITGPQNQQTAHQNTKSWNLMSNGSATSRKGFMDSVATQKEEPVDRFSSPRLTFMKQKFGFSSDEAALQQHHMGSVEDEFLKPEDAAAMLQDDEQEFHKEHMLEGFEVSAVADIDIVQEAAFKQDVTCPSWLSSDGGRVSISRYLGGRSAPMPHPNFGADTSSASAGVTSFTQHPSMCLQRIVEQELGFPAQSQACPSEAPISPRESSVIMPPSASVIDRILLDETSVSTSDMSVITKLIGAARRKQGDCNRRDDDAFKKPLAAAPRLKAVAVSSLTPMSQPSKNVPQQKMPLPAEQECHNTGQGIPDGTDIRECQRSLQKSQSLCKVPSVTSHSTPNLTTETAVSQLHSCSEGDVAAVGLRGSLEAFLNPGRPQHNRDSHSRSREQLQSLHESRLSSVSALVFPGGLSQKRLEVSAGTICVGVSKRVSLMLVNLCEHSLLYRLRQVSSSVNNRLLTGADVVLATFPPVSVSRVSEVHGTFLSRAPGTVMAELDVVPQGEEVRKPCAFRVVLRAQAELPQLEVGPRDGLRFEALEFGAGDCSQQFWVANQGHCDVPIRVVIAKGEGLFSLSHVDSPGAAVMHDSSTALSVLLPSKCQKDKTAFVLKCSTQEAKCLNVEAEIQVYLNGACLSGSPLHSLCLMASIHRPCLVLEGSSPDEPLMVSSTVGRMAAVTNHGNHTLQVQFKATSPFCVSPEHAMLLPSLTVQVSVCLRGSSKDGRLASSCGHLQAVLVPQGFVVDLAILEGMPETGGSCSEAQSSRHGIAVLESSKRAVFWPGSRLGSPVTKTLIIRNPRTTPVKVTLKIPEGGSSPFKVCIPGEGAPSFSAIANLDAGASADVQLTYVPTYVGFDQSRLLLRSHNPGSENKSIPLYGVGGELKLSLHDLPSLSGASHLVDMGQPLPGHSVTREFTLFNGGFWDIFVRFTFSSAGQEDTAGRFQIEPPCLVLHRKESKTVSLLYTFATGDCHMDPKGPIVNLGALRVHYGLEVIRQWAKRTNILRQCDSIRPYLEEFQSEHHEEGGSISFASSVAEEAFLKNVFQKWVVVCCGSAPSLLQMSEAATFLPLETLEDSISGDNPPAKSTWRF